MKQTFADSSFYLAILNTRDAAHAIALAVSEMLEGQIVTTEWVLLEVADAMSSVPNRQRFLDLIDEIEGATQHQIIRSNTRHFQLALQLYRRRSDKNWSLTDCISFSIMQERGLTEALTADHHFEQAGFIALLMHS